VIDQQAAIIRCDAFGTSAWSGGMSSLIWAIEASNLKLGMLTYDIILVIVILIF
jgi:hypothetical protein